MKKTLFFACLISSYRDFAQCPYPASLESPNGTCLGDKLIVHTAHALSQIIWYRDGAVDTTVHGTQTYGNSFTVAGNNGAGNAKNQFSFSSSIFVDEHGNIFIADEENNRVQEWTPGANSGITVAGGNGPGRASNQLYGASAVFVDKNGNIYVGDSYNNRVQKWTPGATSGVTVAGGNGPGSDANQIWAVSGLYVDCNAGVYVSDAFNSRVQFWAAGATIGISVAGGNGLGTAYNQLQTPGALSLDGQNNIYITDVGCACVKKWSPGATSGSIIAGNSVPGPDANQLDVPAGIYVNYYGDFYVADGTRVSKWVGGSATSTTIAGGSGPNAFVTGTSISVDIKGNIYITNTTTLMNGRVQELQSIVKIDTSLIATATGTYYAHVTDVNGFSTNTDSVVINAPLQYPPSVKIKATDSNVAICVPINFTAIASNAGNATAFQWDVSGVLVGTNSATYSNNIFADGDQVYCIMKSNDGCNIVTDTSNIISLNIDPVGHATLTIDASGDPICSGTPIKFTSKLINGSNTPVYDWLLNGNDTGDSSSTYSNTNPINGDVIYCLITSDASCGLAKSNSISIVVYPQPSIVTGQIYNIPNGTSMILNPVITGDISSYLWTPSTFLSDPTIRNPVASPTTDITYTLKVVSANGCSVSEIIKVNTFTPLRIPNVFTPNGDGINDVFFVLGGPQGSSIKEFSIFNRWGQLVFQVKDVTPGDKSFGWNGYFHGNLAPTGTYIYFVNMNYGNGHIQLYKGTLVLIR
jgi:gliding motility-associated-like protein